MSYLSENEAESLQNFDIHLKFLTLKSDISRTIWRIEVSYGSIFAFFKLFHLNLASFRSEFPFNTSFNFRSEIGKNSFQEGHFDPPYFKALPWQCQLRYEYDKISLNMHKYWRQKFQVPIQLL